MRRGRGRGRALRELETTSAAQAAEWRARRRARGRTCRALRRRRSPLRGGGEEREAAVTRAAEASAESLEAVRAELELKISDSERALAATAGKLEAELKSALLEPCVGRGVARRKRGRARSRAR